MGAPFEWRFLLFLWLACVDADDVEDDAEDDEVACPAPAGDGAADEMAGADTHANARDAAIASDLICAFTLVGRPALCCPSVPSDLSIIATWARDSSRVAARPDL